MRIVSGFEALVGQVKRLVDQVNSLPSGGGNTAADISFDHTGRAHTGASTVQGAIADLDGAIGGLSITQQFETASTSVASGGQVPLEWGSGGYLLDLTDPTVPVTTQPDGYYIIDVAFRTIAVADKHYQFDLGGDVHGVGWDTRRSGSLDEQLDAQPVCDSLSWTGFIPQGGAIVASITHDIGSAHDFSLLGAITRLP